MCILSRYTGAVCLFITALFASTKRPRSRETLSVIRRRPFHSQVFCQLCKQFSTDLLFSNSACQKMKEGLLDLKIWVKRSKFLSRAVKIEKLECSSPFWLFTFTQRLDRAKSWSNHIEKSRIFRKVLIITTTPSIITNIIVLISDVT